MNNDVLEETLKPYAGKTRDALLPALWDIQNAAGTIDHQAVESLSHVLRVPMAEIYGVIGFYEQLSSAEAADTTIRLCMDPACALAGAEAIAHDACQQLGIRLGETTPDGRVNVRRGTCLGLCDHAPAALVTTTGSGDTSFGPIADATALLAGQAPAPTPSLRGTPRVFCSTTETAGVETLAAYGGDYPALRHALTTMPPAQVYTEVEVSGLVGKGGAAFPTGLKWKLTAQASAQPHYVVCNADESEPGTFKDRALLERRPHLLLEGILLCAYAIGAETAYIFIRGEYPEGATILQAAIDEAVAAGLAGTGIMGTDFTCAIEIRRGAGAYICGEETALFEAIEGKRGFPRIKPPYPTTNGLFDRPTVVNNVETLCSVPAIVLHGSAWYRERGTDKSTGTKLFSISGHVHQPGVYEVPFGTTLRDLIDTHAGGVHGDLAVVLMGGAAGTFLTPDEIDVPLTFEGLRGIGSTIGSGAIMVFNSQTDLRDVLRRLAWFFEHESCGKCYPCQLGTRRQREILDRLEHPLPGDRQRLEDIGLTMTEASLCGLGQTAAAAVLSAMAKWPELFT